MRCQLLQHRRAQGTPGSKQIISIEANNRFDATYGCEDAKVGISSGRRCETDVEILVVASSIETAAVDQTIRITSILEHVVRT